MTAELMSLILEPSVRTAETADDQGRSTPSGKREQTKAANRATILDAARAVFNELGYDTATVRDIIRRTGLSVGAFYNYYRSKEEVYEALADDGARRFRPILKAQHHPTADFSTYIRGAVTAYLQFVLDEEEAWQLSAPEGARNHPHLRMETPEMLAVYGEVKSAIADGIDRGLAPRVDADYLAAACISVAREIGERMLERRPVNVPAAAEFAVSLILGGLPALPQID